MSPGSSKPLVVFPDANIFLEFERLDDPRWRDAFDRRALTFAVCVHTISEIDKWRNSEKSRLRRRAREVAKWLLAQRESGVGLGNGAGLLIVAGSPVELLSRGDLDRHNPDDMLVACALKYQSHDKGVDTCVLSDDVGVVLKADGFGVRGIQPPSDLRLSVEPTNEERELQALRKENEGLKLGVPRLTLRAREMPLRLSVSAFGSILETYVAKRVALERQKYGVLRALSSVDDERLSAYLEEVRRHEQGVYPLISRIYRTFRLALVLRNDGRAPASDIDVVVNAPAGVTFSSALPEIPEAPRPPRFKSLDIFEFRPTIIDVPSIMSPGLGVPRPSRVGTWKIKGKIEASIHVRKLKHQNVIELPRIFGHFEDEICNGRIEWSAHAENVSQAFVGTLDFVADTGRGDPFDDLLRSDDE